MCDVTYVSVDVLIYSLVPVVASVSTETLRTATHSTKE
jgi:hypothetical protein